MKFKFYFPILIILIIICSLTFAQSIKHTASDSSKRMHHGKIIKTHHTYPSTGTRLPNGQLNHPDGEKHPVLPPGQIKNSHGNGRDYPAKNGSIKVKD